MDRNINHFNVMGYSTQVIPAINKDINESHNTLCASTEQFEQETDGKMSGFKRSANKSLIARRERLDLNKELQPFEQPRILG